MLELLDLAAKRKRENKLAAYQPYPKQRDFHAAGAQYRERLFLAGNQLGKTLSGGMEMAYHATGRYPDWWQGKRYEHGTKAWVAGETGDLTRDGVQRILMGEVGQPGTGCLPKDSIISVKTARGVPNALDSVLVRHSTGDTSYIGFKSYREGRENWQAETLHLVWYDEEPPADVYTEGLTRTNATGGGVYLTFTPLLGMSTVVQRFLGAPHPDRHVTIMTIDEALHYTPEQRARIIESYPEHERDARAKGIPMLGSGRVFPVADSAVSCDPFTLPSDWPRLCAMDFGIDHPTAAVWVAWNKDADIVYLYDTHRLTDGGAAVHAAAIRARGVKIPVVWPHDGLQREKGSGQQIAQIYRDHGLNLLPDPVRFEDGTNGVEAGVMRLLERMRTGRFKAFSHLNDWFAEFRQYHRKDGLIVKERDDLMAATRYAEMGLRFASSGRASVDYHALFGR